MKEEETLLTFDHAHHFVHDGNAHVTSSKVGTGPHAVVREILLQVLLEIVRRLVISSYSL